MEEKRKHKRVKADWVVTCKAYYSQDYVAGEFTDRFTIDGLIRGLRDRGINLPNGAGITFINENILTNKKLYAQYPELSIAQKDQDIISSFNEYEIKRFNRDLINRFDPQRSPNNQSHKAILSSGSRIKNISETGLCFLSSSYIPVESIVEMEIRTDDLPGPMKIWARVVKTANLNDSKFKFELGVVFLDIDYDYVKRKALHDYIERHVA